MPLINDLLMAIIPQSKLLTFLCLLPASKRQRKVTKEKENPAHHSLTVSTQILVLYPRRYRIAFIAVQTVSSPYHQRPASEPPSLNNSTLTNPTASHQISYTTFTIPYGVIPHPDAGSVQPS